MQQGLMGWRNADSWAGRQDSTLKFCRQTKLGSLHHKLRKMFIEKLYGKRFKVQSLKHVFTTTNSCAIIYTQHDECFEIDQKYKKLSAKFQDSIGICMKAFLRKREKQLLEVLQLNYSCWITAWEIFHFHFLWFGSPRKLSIFAFWHMLLFLLIFFASISLDLLSFS